MDPVKRIKAEMEKREVYWAEWNGRAANHAAKLEKEIETLRNTIETQDKEYGRLLTLEKKRGDELQRRLDIVWDWMGQQSDAQWKFKYDIPEAKDWFEDE